MPKTPNTYVAKCFYVKFRAERKIKLYYKPLTKPKINYYLEDADGYLTKITKREYHASDLPTTSKPPSEDMVKEWIRSAKMEYGRYWEPTEINI